MPTCWKPSSRPQAFTCATSAVGSIGAGRLGRGRWREASIMACMNAPGTALYAAEQVRDLDRRAIHEFGIPGYELMTRAGHATLNAIRARWPRAQSITVLCGPGNNGGDGYVVARVAKAVGLRARVIASADPARLTGDARRAYDDFAASGGRCESWT